jgi:hypothetical protein
MSETKAYGPPDAAISAVEERLRFHLGEPEYEEAHADLAGDLLDEAYDPAVARRPCHRGHGPRHLRRRAHDRMERDRCAVTTTASASTTRRDRTPATSTPPPARVRHDPALGLDGSICKRDV